MSEITGTPKRNWNWRIWAGFLLAVAALLSYGVIFIRFPITRDVPWLNWLLFAGAGWLLWTGARRARQEPTVYHGKIAGPILIVLGLTMAAFFIVGTTYFTKHLPASKEAPKVGARAPEFALADTNGKMVTLAALLSEPMPEREGAGAKPRGVALIFYRGYW
jgi:hypothetical protein